MNLYVGLVHHPISNKRGEVVTTSVTNMDIHDISRSCRTFNVKRFFIITPLSAQHRLVGRILHHWEQDKSCAYNPDRHDALSIVELSMDIEGTISRIAQIEEKEPILVVTGAGIERPDGDVSALNNRIELDKRPCLLLFGTGWGLHASIMEQADFRLNSLKCSIDGDYNHLSVRSAVAIYLDRLRGSL
ncbi:MAG: RNA methyltransferase [Bacteriovoracaceae bacterium]|nr:RNA methyltransferase [Bacteriovoracaceae bacterium]